MMKKTVRNLCLAMMLCLLFSALVGCGKNAVKQPVGNESVSKPDSKNESINIPTEIEEADAYAVSVILEDNEYAVLKSSDVLAANEYIEVTLIYEVDNPDYLLKANGTATAVVTGTKITKDSYAWHIDSISYEAEPEISTETVWELFKDELLNLGTTVPELGSLSEFSQTSKNSFQTYVDVTVYTDTAKCFGGVEISYFCTDSSLDIYPKEFQNHIFDVYVLNIQGAWDYSYGVNLYTDCYVHLIIEGLGSQNDSVTLSCFKRLSDEDTYSMVFEHAVQPVYELDGEWFFELPMYPHNLKTDGNLPKINFNQFKMYTSKTRLAKEGSINSFEYELVDDDGESYAIIEGTKLLYDVSIPECILGYPVKEVYLRNNIVKYKNVITVEIPEGVEVLDIEYYGLNSLELPSTLRDLTIDHMWCIRGGFPSLELPDGLENLNIDIGSPDVGWGQASWSNMFCDLDIPFGVKTLCLTGCNMTSLNLPESVEYVSINKLNELQSLVLPKSVTVLEGGYFCNSLESITLPSSLSEMQFHIGESVNSLYVEKGSYAEAWLISMSSDNKKIIKYTN